VNLGRFRIVLDWNDHDLENCYRAVALQPYPAGADETVTHPHVKNEYLCAGEGRTAIHTALKEGRIYDFFLLVARVLDNYAPGNAFVELDHWQGESCRDCSQMVTGEEAYCCERCDSTVCSDCQQFCDRCNAALCSGCASACAVCRSTCCRHCRTSCRVCRRMTCSKCHVDSVCQPCQEESDAEAYDGQPDVPSMA
jgi:hypothetical protein